MASATNVFLSNLLLPLEDVALALNTPVGVAVGEDGGAEADSDEDAEGSSRMTLGIANELAVIGNGDGIVSGLPASLDNADNGELPLNKLVALDAKLHRELDELDP